MSDMSTKKSAMPLAWALPRELPEGHIVRFHKLTIAKGIWDRIADAGYDPEKMVMKSWEQTSGALTIGFYENEFDDINKPAKDLGFLIEAEDRWYGPRAGYLRERSM